MDWFSHITLDRRYFGPISIFFKHPDNVSAIFKRLETQLYGVQSDPQASQVTPLQFSIQLGKWIKQESDPPIEISFNKYSESEHDHILVAQLSGSILFQTKKPE